VILGWEFRELASVTGITSRAKFLIYARPVNLRTLEDTMTDLDEGLLLSKFLVPLIHKIIDVDGPGPVDPQWLTGVCALSSMIKHR
jgi:hypothetical protein